MHERHSKQKKEQKARDGERLRHEATQGRQSPPPKEKRSSPCPDSSADVVPGSEDTAEQTFTAYMAAATQKLTKDSQENGELHKAEIQAKVRQAEAFECMAKAQESMVGRLADMQQSTHDFQLNIFQQMTAHQREQTANSNALIERLMDKLSK